MWLQGLVAHVAGIAACACATRKCSDISGKRAKKTIAARVATIATRAHVAARVAHVVAITTSAHHTIAQRRRRR
ncbi:hypothetical protein Sjap_006143 [Stephania japonica]|uniref:Secreted protein n=1 Tax=Stephania japonica TaxID=461633 RepID=A0AAP0K6H2_9MAGN